MKKKMKIADKLVIYFILYFLLLIVCTNIIGNMYVYDPAWAAFIIAVYIGLPFLVGGTIVMGLLLRRGIRRNYEIITGIAIAAVMVLAFSTMIPPGGDGLPGAPWEYNEELSELYTQSKLWGTSENYRVYIGDTCNEGREARVYFNDGLANSQYDWELYETGIVKDGKLFINNWRVYPTEYVGVSHLGENPEGDGMVVYLDNLTTMADSYRMYFKDDSGDFLTNLTKFNVTVGDILAVYGDREDGPDKYGVHYDYLIVDNIEVVETLD